MIGTVELQNKVSGYGRRCIENQKQPTYAGFGAALEVSGLTIKHIVTGYYKGGHEYTEKPHPTRCVDNNDFDLIRALFDKRD